jgi:hypothetical protein
MLAWDVRKWPTVYENGSQAGNIDNHCVDLLLGEELASDQVLDVQVSFFAVAAGTFGIAGSPRSRRPAKARRYHALPGRDTSH